MANLPPAYHRWFAILNITLPEVLPHFHLLHKAVCEFICSTAQMIKRERKSNAAPSICLNVEWLIAYLMVTGLMQVLPNWAHQLQNLSNLVCAIDGLGSDDWCGTQHHQFEVAWSFSNEEGDCSLLFEWYPQSANPADLFIEKLNAVSPCKCINCSFELSLLQSTLCTTIAIWCHILKLDVFCLLAETILFHFSFYLSNPFFYLLIFPLVLHPKLMSIPLHALCHQKM